MEAKPEALVLDFNDINDDIPFGSSAPKASKNGGATLSEGSPDTPSRAPAVEDEKDRLQRATVSPIIARAGAIAIANAGDYEKANSFLGEIKAAAKKIGDWFRPSKEAAAKAHKAICQQEKDMLDPLGVAEKTVKDKMLAYYTAQERIRQEEDRRRSEEAERIRKEAEELASKAVEAQANGDTAKAEELASKSEEKVFQSAEVSAATYSGPAVRASGSSVRMDWKARVVDKSKLPLDYLIPDQKQLDAIAKATKGARTIPGVEFYSEAILSRRA